MDTPWSTPAIQPAGLREYKQVLAQDPNNLPVRTNIGYAYIAAGNYKAAIESLSQVTHAHPEDAGAHYDLGVAYKQSDDLPHAKTELEETIRLRPSLVEARYVLGVTFEGLGDTEKSVEQLRAAVAQRPNYTDAWFELATVLKGRGDIDGAIDALRHSVALDDKDACAFKTPGIDAELKGPREWRERGIRPRRRSARSGVARKAEQAATAAQPRFAALATRKPNTSCPPPGLPARSVCCASTSYLK